MSSSSWCLNLPIAIQGCKAAPQEILKLFCCASIIPIVAVWPAPANSCVCGAPSKVMSLLEFAGGLVSGVPLWGQYARFY
jgi:hypothetical protein